VTGIQILMVSAAGLLVSFTGLLATLTATRKAKREREDHARVLSLRTQQIQSYDRHLEQIRSAVETGMKSGSVCDPADPWLRGYRACAETVLKEIGDAKETSSP